MKSFRQFIKEEPTLSYDMPKSSEKLSRPSTYLDKKFSERFDGYHKKTSLGTMDVDGVSHGVMHTKDETDHVISLVHPDGTIKGFITGKSVLDDYGAHHIDIFSTRLHDDYQGKGLYPRLMAHFVNNTPHVLYTGTSQSPGAKKAWQHLTANSEGLGVHVQKHDDTKYNGVRKGIPITRADDSLWDRDGSNTSLSVRGRV